MKWTNVRSQGTDMNTTRRNGSLGHTHEYLLSIVGKGGNIWNIGKVRLWCVVYSRAA